jgi:hypothetical protein
VDDVTRILDTDDWFVATRIRLFEALHEKAAALLALEIEDARFQQVLVQTYFKIR